MTIPADEPLSTALDVYLHDETQGKYHILCLGVVKQDGLWMDCVIYQPDSLGGIYVRREDDFRAKFTKALT